MDDPFPSSASVNEALRRGGKRVWSLGKVFGGEEILCAEAGGEKRPAILVTAGAHSPEAAGVVASLRILDELSTSHKVYVIPMRDPFGFNCFDHCLSALLGRPVVVRSHQDVVARLRQDAEIVWDGGELVVGLIGDVGIVTMDTADEPMGYEVILRALHAVARQQPALTDALRGRRFFVPSSTPKTEGAGRFGRTYTGVVSPEGQILSLSQFFGRDDAPPEVAYLDAFVREMKPGLTFDCHEDCGGPEFYLPARRHQVEPERAERIVRAMWTAVEEAGYPLLDFDRLVARYSQYLPYWPRYHQPSGRPGLFWTDGLKRGIGYILADYALRFGFSMPIETGGQAPLAQRVDCHVRAVSAGVAALEGSSDAAF
ncbi:MAG: hypothetical protein ACRDIY_01860 [Chloroflexota bacterium]